MGFKKTSIFILLTLAILLLADFCFAQRELEVPLPEMGTTELPLLPDYVKYIFNFAIGIAGFVAFGCLVYGGARYVFSAGNPDAMADANDQIFAGLIGLIVILGSWLLLTTINPQLIVISPQPKPSELKAEKAIGVYLCKDSAGIDCQIFTSPQASLGDLNNKVEYVKFKNPEEYNYGVVLREDKDYKGRCAACLRDGCQSEIAAIGGDGVSSIHVFMQADSSPGEGVTLYECKEYDTKSTTGGHLCQKWGPFSKIWPYKNHNSDLGEKGRSIKIDEGGKYLAALFEGEDTAGKCEVFTQSDPNLANNYIGICGLGSNMGCFRSIIVLPIR